MPDFVEPAYESRTSLEDQIGSAVSVSARPAHVPLLTEVLTLPGVLPPGAVFDGELDDDWEQALGILASKAGEASGLDEAGAVVFGALTHQLVFLCPDGDPWQIDDDAARSVLELLKHHDINVCRGIREFAANGDKSIRDLAELIDLLDAPHHLLDGEQVKTGSAEGPFGLRAIVTRVHHDRPIDTDGAGLMEGLRQIDDVLGRTAIELALPWLGECSPGEVGLMALGICKAVAAIDGNHPTNDSDVWITTNPPLLIRSFELLDAARSAQADPGTEVERMWLRFGRRAIAALRRHGVEVPGHVETALLDRAREVVARARPVLRGDKPESELDFDLMQEAVTTLADVGGVWRALKPLLLAFSNLAEPAVGDDLRYWKEWNDPQTHPPRWARLPMWMASTVHLWVGVEQEADPDLVELRSELAVFCGERLKVPKKGGAPTPVEPRASWRMGYVRAIDALKVNPRGQLRRVLHFVATNDTDEDVRREASKVHRRMTAGAELPDGVSPRRPVLEALWWLRQAHAISLGVTPDPEAARKTLRKEVRRTNEAEGLQ